MHNMQNSFAFFIKMNFESATVGKNHLYFVGQPVVIGLVIADPDNYRGIKSAGIR